MSHVTFFLLGAAPEQAPATSSLPNNASTDASASWLQACNLAAQCHRSRQRCLVFFDNQQDAEAFDDLLWQLPVDAFVPHNLAGEGPKNGAPVELIWQAPHFVNRPVLINLSSNMPAFADKCQRVYDFVPAEEADKQQARERYKHYRAAGHQLDTQPAA